MHEKIVAGCIALTAMVVASAAQAQWVRYPGTFYLGVSGGQTKANVPDDANPPVPGALSSTQTRDDKDSGYKVYFGQRVLPNFAFEVGYTDFGTYTIRRNVTASSTPGGTGEFRSEVSVSGVHVDALGILPAGPDVDLFGKVGIVGTRTSNTLSTTSPAFVGVSPDDHSGSSLKLGVGAEWRIATVGLRLEYEQMFNVGDSNTTGGKFDIRMVSAGLTVRF